MMRDELLQATDEQIMEEVSKLLYAYGTHIVIRYKQKRKESTVTESVSEHIHAMHVIADFFMELEGLQDLDYRRIHQMITWHELGEIELGDIALHNKTSEDYKQEVLSQEIALGKLPVVLRGMVKDRIDEFEQGHTREARFVHATDRLEPSFAVLRNGGKKRLVEELQITREQLQFIDAKVKKACEEFPTMSRFAYAISEHVFKEKYFIK